MEIFKNRRLGKWLAVFGSFLLTFPMGVPGIWGNVGMYALSHIAVRGRVKTGVDTPWIVSIFYVCLSVGVFLAGRPKSPGIKRLVLCAAVLVYVAGLGLTYLTVETSVAMVTVSVGLLSGLGGGVVYGMAIQHAGAWAGKDLGLVTCIVHSATQIGPAVINPLFTIFVNPDNLSPSTEVNSIKLFSQPEVLDRVPLAFLLLAMASICCMSLGVICLKEARNNYKEDTQLVDNGSDYDGVQLAYTDETDEDSSEKLKNTNSDDMTVGELVTSPAFYCLCIVYLQFANSAVALLNYYKVYGAVWIDNDHFLSSLGIPFMAASGAGVLLSGWVSDRIGVKKTMIFLLISSCWLFLLMYFTPMVGKWLYLLNLLLVGCCVPPLFPMVAIATRVLFGNGHYMRNFALVTSLGIASDCLNPVLLQLVLSTGWFYVFLFGSGSCAVGLVVIVILLPRI